jgi:hypothetical protein
MPYGSTVINFCDKKRRVFTASEHRALGDFTASWEPIIPGLYLSVQVTDEGEDYALLMDGEETVRIHIGFQRNGFFGDSMNFGYAEAPNLNTLLKINMRGSVLDSYMELRTAENQHAGLCVRLVHGTADCSTSSHITQRRTNE